MPYFYFDQMLQDRAVRHQRQPASCPRSSRSPAARSCSRPTVQTSMRLSCGAAMSGRWRSGQWKYFIIGLIFLNYGQIFLGVITMFITRWRSSFVGRTRWDGCLRHLATRHRRPFQSVNTWQSFLGLGCGYCEQRFLSLILLFIRLRRLCHHVCDLLRVVLALWFRSCTWLDSGACSLPGVSTTPLGTHLLTNLIVFQAWGLIYAIMGCQYVGRSTWGTVGPSPRRGSAGGFFAGASKRFCWRSRASCLRSLYSDSFHSWPGASCTEMWAARCSPSSAWPQRRQPWLRRPPWVPSVVSEDTTQAGGESGSAAPVPSGPPPVRDGGARFGGGHR